jgi:hypothetical protein
LICWNFKNLSCCSKNPKTGWTDAVKLAAASAGRAGSEFTCVLSDLARCSECELAERVTQAWNLCFSWKYETYAYAMLWLWSYGYIISLICVIWPNLMEIMYLRLKCIIMIFFWNEFGYVHELMTYIHAFIYAWWAGVLVRWLKHGIF